MAAFYDSLIEKLRAATLAGKEPKAIRVRYGVYCKAMLEDPEFEDEMYYGKEIVTFMGLPVIFDSWCTEPRIDV